MQPSTKSLWTMWALFKGSEQDAISRSASVLNLFDCSYYIIVLKNNDRVFVFAVCT